MSSGFNRLSSHLPTYQYNVKLVRDYQETLEITQKNPPDQYNSSEIFNSHNEAKAAQTKVLLEFKP